LGAVRSSVADSTGLKGVEVVLPGTHDTASAVMAVPASGEPSDRPDWCYISSGTWSLMGMETPSPIVNEACSRFNFTNEGGVGGTTRLLKNIAGLWLLQECRRIWTLQGKELGWDDMVQRAQSARPLVSLIDPDAGAFLAPQDMPEAIRQFCADSGQAAPDDEGAVVRCALESLALRYRMVLNMAESLTGAQVKTIHIVGGGTQNRLLCQMAADACNRHVLSGPVEATAIGNVMMQAVASGDVASIAEARQVIRNSFPMHEYEPQDPGPWDEAFERFEKIVNK
jgi:rhamnulokinase